MFGWGEMCGYFIMMYSIVCVYLRTYFLKMINVGVLHNHRDYSSVRYIDGSKFYECRFPKKRGVRANTKFSTETPDGVSADITENIKKLSGSGGWLFHSLRTTPKMLGLENVYVHTGDDIVMYNTDDVIV